MFKITKNWYELLRPQLESDEFKQLQSFLATQYNTKNIYPAPENVFNALNLVKFDDVKVVIIGQDPYHGAGQAHGLSFSVQKGVAIPPSLRNIYKELHDDLGCQIPNHGDLTKWAKQGVLLLNSVLTVEEGKPNSHKDKGWELITGQVIKLLNDRKKPVIFMLWGANAKALGANIDKTKHYVLTATHPSPMSVSHGGWFGCKHFSKANLILQSIGQTPIDWQID